MDKEIKLIPDTECNLDEKEIDVMGTLPYVDVLEKIVEENIENYTPFTIGLFGGWGSGKSSIIRTLSARLSKKNVSNKAMSVIYNAWKYSGDAFRRSFILELKDQLNLDWEKSLEVFYTEKHEDISSTIGITRKWWVIPLCLTPLIALIVWYLNPLEFSVNVGVSILSLIVTIIAFVLSQTFVKYKIAVTTPKIFSPEQFKEVFDQAIDDTTGENHSGLRRWWKKVISKGNECKQVVVVIDNIDRCDKKAAKELLLNIKTYLEHKRCIVIVPIDDVAIKSHLEYIGDEEAEEFLRKIFNVSIRIKGFNNIDRYEFTKNLIEKHSLGFSDEVASVISQEFAKNPRRIIQFLNSLALEKEVARAQEEKGLIPEGSVTNNIDFLAKVLLIKEEYPLLHEAIVSDGLNISNWDKSYTREEYPKEERELRMFFGRTSGLVTPKDIMPFLLLQAKSDALPPEFENLIQAGNTQEVMTKIENDSIDFDILLNYLDDILDTKLMKRRVTAFPELNFLLLCFSDDKIVKKLVKRQNELFRYFNCINNEYIGEYSFPTLLKTAGYLKRIGQVGLYKTIISHIDSGNDIKVVEFIEHFNSRDDLLMIKKTINNVLAGGLEHFETLLPYLADKELSPGFIKPKTISDHVAKLSAARTDKDTKICQTVKSCLFAGLLPKTTRDNFLNSILAFLQKDQSHTSCKFWLEQVKECLRLGPKGSELLKWLKQVFDSTVFPNRTDTPWREVSRVMIHIFEEYIVLGEKDVWKSLSMLYLLDDDLSESANASLKVIVSKTSIEKWDFLDDVIKKTTNMNISNKYFNVAGDILQKGKGHAILSEKPELLKNWLNFVVAKEETEKPAQEIIQLYCKEDIFNNICQQDPNLTKSVLAKAKSLSMKEVINSIAEIILQDPSSTDVKYLIEQQYDKTDLIKNAIKKGIAEEKEEFEWYNLVIETADIWTGKEYSKLLENKLLHLATGNDDEREQVKQVWVNVNKDKLSKSNVKNIEAMILENEKEIIEGDIGKEDEVEKE